MAKPEAVDWMAGAVVAWVASQPPATLAATAAADQDVSGAILRQYRPYLALAAVWAGPYRDAIATAGPDTFERILDRVLAQAPAQGTVCWQHKAWFFRQLAAARDAWVTQAGGGAG